MVVKGSLTPDAVSWVKDRGKELIITCGFVLRDEVRSEIQKGKVN